MTRSTNFAPTAWSHDEDGATTMNGYAYYRPHTLDEAFAIADRNPGARFVAGGTDLFVQLEKRRLAEPTALISLRNIPSLSGLEIGARVRIGSAMPLADVGAHPTIRTFFPALASAIDVLGSRQIRNVATLGGNLCNASPAADTAPALLVYDAHVELESPRDTRSVPLDIFFRGPGKTILDSGEIMTAVTLERPKAPVQAHFMRKGRVKMDLAIAIVATRLAFDGERCAEARVAVGAVAPIPLRLTAVERLLEGTAIDDLTVEKAKDAAREAISPITDLRSTADYRREIVGVWLGRALDQARKEHARS